MNTGTGPLARARIVRRVSLAGFVSGAEGVRSGGGRVRARIEAADGAPAWMRTCAVRPDGLFFFLDLPAARYALDGEDECGAALGEVTVSVAAPDPAAPGAFASADLFARPADRTDAPGAAREGPG